MSTVAGSLLLVEDHEEVARTNARLFSSVFDVLIASSRAQALKIVDERERSIAAALVDVQLPDGSGLDVADRLLRNARTSVAILTGTDDPAIRRWAFERLVPLVHKGDCGLPVLARWADRVRRSLPAVRIARGISALGWEEAPTPKERETLLVAALHATTSRKELAALRGVREDTIKSQVNAVVRKAGIPSLRRLIELVGEHAEDEARGAP